MSDTPFEKVKKTAGDVMHRLGEMAHSAGEQLAELQETQRLATRIRDLRKERARCQTTLADLVVRMFDQGAFVEALLKPEYCRIKEIDAEVLHLEAQKAVVGAKLEDETPCSRNAGGQDAVEPGTLPPGELIADGPAETTLTEIVTEKPAEDGLAELPPGQGAA